MNIRASMIFDDRNTQFCYNCIPLARNDVLDFTRPFSPPLRERADNKRERGRPRETRSLSHSVPEIRLHEVLQVFLGFKMALEVLLLLWKICYYALIFHIPQLIMSS